MRRTARTPTQSKNWDNEWKQSAFHTDDAGLLSNSAVAASRPHASPGGGWFAGVVTGELTDQRTLCPCCARAVAVLRARGARAARALCP